MGHAFSCPQYSVRRSGPKSSQRPPTLGPSTSSRARTAAAYLTIANTGAADRLLRGTTPAARAVEVHTHVDERGLQL